MEALRPDLFRHEALLATATRHRLLPLGGAVQDGAGGPGAERRPVVARAVRALVQTQDLALLQEVRLQGAPGLHLQQRPGALAPRTALSRGMVLPGLGALQHGAGLLGADHLAVAAAALQAGVVGDDVAIIRGDLAIYFAF